MEPFESTEIDTEGGDAGAPTGGSSPAPSTKPRRFGAGSLALIAAGAVVLVLAIVFGQGFGKDPKLFTSPLIGTQVPSLTLPYLEQDGELRLDSLRGDILVINFWASWCLPCRVEHPILNEGANAYRDFGVTFVSVDSQDSTSNAIAFLDELGRSPEMIYLVDSESRAALAFGVTGIPETFFIDRDGIVVGKVSGALNGPLLAGTIDRIMLGEAVESVKTGEVQNRP